MVSASHASHPSPLRPMLRALGAHLIGSILLIPCVSPAADGGGSIDAARLRAEVLYLDLANPTTARGIAPADDKELANLERRERGGVPAAAPKKARKAMVKNEKDPSLRDFLVQALKDAGKAFKAHAGINVLLS